MRVCASTRYREDDAPVRAPLVQAIYNKSLTCRRLVCNCVCVCAIAGRLVRPETITMPPPISRWASHTRARARVRSKINFRQPLNSNGQNSITFTACFLLLLSVGLLGRCLPQGGRARCTSFPHINTPRTGVTMYTNEYARWYYETSARRAFLAASATRDRNPHFLPANIQYISCRLHCAAISVA